MLNETYKHLPENDGPSTDNENLELSFRDKNTSEKILNWEIAEMYKIDLILKWKKKYKNFSYHLLIALLDFISYQYYWYKTYGCISSIFYRRFVAAHCL